MEHATVYGWCRHHPEVPVLVLNRRPIQCSQTGEMVLLRPYPKARGCPTCQYLNGDDGKGLELDAGWLTDKRMVKHNATPLSWAHANPLPFLP